MYGWAGQIVGASCWLVLINDHATLYPAYMVVTLVAGSQIKIESLQIQTEIPLTYKTHLNISTE